MIVFKLWLAVNLFLMLLFALELAIDEDAP